MCRTKICCCALIWLLPVLTELQQTHLQMVAAGFYHVPDPVDKDTARCFFCCQTICAFEETDNPV